MQAATALQSDLSQERHVGTVSVYVGQLQWWTTDAELETACSEYGHVEEVKVFEDKANGKSKGYAQVTFADGASALACKAGLNG